jgi:hypothetical protein
MTAIVQPSDPGEEKDFATWDTRISNPPSGSSEDKEAAAAADWILNTYLDTPKFPSRQVYREKVRPWALTAMVLFGKLGTAVGSHAKFGEDTECVGYWDNSGSTMAWTMSISTGVGRYLFGGLVDDQLEVTQVGLFDITGVAVGQNPSTATLKTNDRWTMFFPPLKYDDLEKALDQIVAGNYVWKKN